MKRVYTVGYSNCGVADYMTVDASDERAAAGVASQEGAELIMWVEGPFESHTEADQFGRDNP